ncbi:S-layer homology domain-containing protein [Caloranaerobacter azorensis DSM 13643]|uniref:S-layer homology domain-containing protein n=1 Tax=Caloranaerobacter azorensis DSM 13643 TaxID=1121264 RepID=A0A1M5SMS9_9FIRM|nr:S-layer homology domain-containing protein [Caloranaerobacter azorensis]SHH39243.1 S-layer homology domain-containing protein [Caloranaerobacter azorensis DSM 13643]
MKKISVILVLVLMLNPFIVYAKVNNAGFEGGIHKNEMDYKKTKQYKEVIFLTGEPILLEGTVAIKIKDKRLQYKYELSSKDGQVTLERDIELERIIDQSSHPSQIVEVNNILDYDEEIVIKNGKNKTTYTLVDYQFHNSTIDDCEPVVAFYSGNWVGTKTYSINKDEGQVVVEITGNIYGYDHYWGATETQKIHKDINYTLNSGDTTLEWSGYADIDVSFNRTKNIEYFENAAYLSSFDGGYTLTEKEETIMEYKYNLPYLDKTEQEQERVVAKLRNKGNGVERFETHPTQKKMYIPKFEDIKGYWAEKDIKKLAGLQIIDANNKYFGGNLPIERQEFAKWIAKAVNLVKEEKKPKRSYVKPEINPPVFSDVTRENPDYEYIKAIKEKGIMNGIGDNKFMPKGNLTRAQAVTIIIRALGIERLAPNPPFTTRFRDDEKIPKWAKKAIYVAQQIGLAEGSPEGYFYPNDYMTRAEAAVFLNRFISYLQEDFKTYYRDMILGY